MDTSFILNFLLLLIIETKKKTTQPLSKQAETEFMKNVTKVLMLANSKKGTLLRQRYVLKMLF